jgi:FlaA1/EpsC-like NDP-sugar epimerase
VRHILVRARGGRVFLLVAYDFTCWVVGFASMAGVQVAVGYSDAQNLGAATMAGVLCGLGFVLLGLPLHLHHGRTKIGSFYDAVLVSGLAAVVAAVTMVVNVLVGSPMRVSVTVIGPCVAFGLLLGARAAYRLMREWVEVHPPNTRLRRPVVVIGAGLGGTQLIQSMVRDPECPWEPVALVDDDPAKRHRRLNGVPVLGLATEFADVAESVGARTVIMAVPSATSELVRTFNRQAVQHGLELKVVPSASDLTNPAQLQINDVRDIEVTDFLGRKPIETDVHEIAGYLAHQRVLVTGAGGSIGSELCRQIAKFGPERLVMLDRDESALHAVQLSIDGRALTNSEDLELVDIRDTARVREVFRRHRPDVVFHAAALKHLPLLEGAPGEAVKTNVRGTQVVLDAARECHVLRFVNISTDKAASPCSVLGWSKRVSEGLTAAAGAIADGDYLSVRFGNVLGSRGSVLTTFTAQIAQDGPVTVTDPRVTRFFMTIREAVQLVIQAGAIGGGGDVLVLDMGEPVAIADVAQQLIELSGKQVDIVYTGLRPGEKLHEEVFGPGEVDLRPRHELISHVPVPPCSDDVLRDLDPDADAWIVRAGLRAAAEEMDALPQGNYTVDLGRT